MEIHVRGKNMPLTDALKGHVEKKIGKLARHFGQDPVKVEAVLSVERDSHVVEVTLPLEGGRVIRGQESSTDMYASVDLVVQKLERQLDRLKAHNKARPPHGAGDRPAPTAAPDELTQVVRRKTFPVKPMSLDEAILQMHLVSHDFFAFTNAETETINVLYRRRDGSLGLLEPS
jgi:putative sigma-54 modulation protein